MSTTLQIRALLDAKLAEQRTSIWGDYVNMLKMLKGLFKSERHWLLEFLQNAEDVHAQRFSVRFDDEALQIMNDGYTISGDDLRSLCGVHSHKSRAQGHLGYLGLGFKSIFRVTDRVDVHSGTFHFKFDRSEWVGHEPLTEWPWEVLPLEIEPTPLPEGFITSFRIPTTDTRFRSLSDALARFMGGPDFPSEITLLLDNVTVLEVQLPGRTFVVRREVPSDDKSGGVSLLPGGPHVRRISILRQEDGSTDRSHYLVTSRKVPVTEDVAKDRTTEEDARRYGVRQCQIGVILGLDAADEPVELQGRLAGVYSFLPLEGEETGLPFGVFGDFVPDPGRDLVKYDLLWNRWLCLEIVNLFRDTVEKFSRSPNAWGMFPAHLLNALYESCKTTTAGGLGPRFWQDHLQKPIFEILCQGRFYQDHHGELRTLGELVFLSRTVREALGKEGIQLLGERLPQKYVASEALESIIGSSARGPAETLDEVYYLLKNRLLLEGLSTSPGILRELYCDIAELSSRQLGYRLRGRDGRDTRLDTAPFVLGEDNQLHAIGDIIMLPEDIGSFGELQRGSGKVLLHSEITQDAEAVSQLVRCGLQVLERPSILTQMQHFVSQCRSQKDCEGMGQRYPDDIIEATLYLAANDLSPQSSLLVSQDEAMVEARHLFLPGAHLDWMRVWQDGHLPSYAPLHALYTDPTKLSKLSISMEKAKKFFQSLGVHGFDAVGDKDLIEDAAYAIAETQLRNEGHNPVRVHHRQEVGYDMQCQGHCKAVFEVKGMSNPGDIVLEPRETEVATIYREDYYLVCIHGLPAHPVCAPPLKDPIRVCQPIERARVPKAAWLSPS